MKAGVLFNVGALWIGAHWSRANRRWCINLLPMLTIWIALRGGKVPERENGAIKRPRSGAGRG